MTIRDVQADFTYTSSAPYLDITGAAGTYIGANSYDTSPLGGALTELSAADTTLTANTNSFRDMGGGSPMWLVVDWIVAPTNGTSCQSQLITSAASSLSSPTTMVDFGAVAIATLVKGYRQIIKIPRSLNWLQWIGFQVVTLGTMNAGRCIAWLGTDVDALTLGYASGYSVK